MFAPFAIRSFRFQWAADLTTSWAFEMETLILGWYILVQTGSVFLLTVFGSLQFAGTLIAPAFGLAGDRIGTRNVIVTMRVTYALLASVLATLVIADALTPYRVLAIAALAGLVRPSDMRLRNVLIGDTVTHDRLMSAISLSRITTESARVAGALFGASIVAVLGMSFAYPVVVMLYALSAALTMGVTRRVHEPSTAARASPWRDLREGAKAVWETPEQLAAMLFAFLVNLTAFPFTLGLLPYVAREIYGTSQAGLGYLVASVGTGAIIAALLLSRLGTSVRPARTMVIFSIVWHVLLIAFGHSEQLRSGMMLLLFAGVSQSFCMLSLALLLLRGAPPALRGRIMGMRTQAVYGLPIGLLVAGPLIDRLGFAATATLYGGVGVACTLLLATRWRASLWSRSAEGNRG